MAPRYSTINGRRIEHPVVEIDGLKAEELPFMSEQFTPIPPFFPWNDFTTFWGDDPYGIGDREE